MAWPSVLLCFLAPVGPACPATCPAAAWVSAASGAPASASPDSVRKRLWVLGVLILLKFLTGVLPGALRHVRVHTLGTRVM